MKRKQEKENQLRNMFNYITDNKIMSQNVHWNAKNIKRDETRNYMNQRMKFDLQQEKFLDLRRKKLSERLNKEEAMYHQELINNQESPDDVRRRMEIKLKELREQRLNDRDENVQKLQEKRFYEATDELRKNDSEAFAVECYLEQENQMLDKLKKREKEKREEMFYVKLNEFDIEKKKEKEREEEKIKKNKLKDIYDYQQWQRDQNEKAIKHNQDIDLLEKIKSKMKKDKIDTHRTKKDIQEEIKEKENREKIADILNQIDGLQMKDKNNFYNLEEEEEKQKLNNKIKKYNITKRLPINQTLQINAAPDNMVFYEDESGISEEGEENEDDEEGEEVEDNEQSNEQQQSNSFNEDNNQLNDNKSNNMEITENNNNIIKKNKNLFFNSRISTINQENKNSNEVSSNSLNDNNIKNSINSHKIENQEKPEEEISNAGNSNEE